MTKTLLLIGAGGNLGRAVARRFGREGFRLVLVGRRREPLEAQARELAAAGVAAAEVEICDAADLGAVRAMVSAVEARHGALEALVYNAAAVRRGALLEQPPETLASDLLANAGGAMAAAQAALPAMLARGKGTMLFTGGGLALDPMAAYTSLSVGKCALSGFVKCLVQDPALAAVHFAHVIVHAGISPAVGEELAELYWELHAEPQHAWRTEYLFQRPWSA